MKWSSIAPNFILILFILLGVIFMSPILAISFGIIYSYIYINNAQAISAKISTIPLQIGIVLLGFTISLDTLIPIFDVYAKWVIYFIVFSFISSFFLGKLLGLDMKLNILVASGLSICGATAISIVGPIIKANNKYIFMSLGILFLFNTLAIMLFPLMGKFLEMSYYEFGVFSALTIHDTGSVVGSALAFSNQSIEVAVSIKILRTLGLIPLIILLNYKFNSNQKTFTFPRFIIYFFVALAISNMFDLTYLFIEYSKILSKIFIIIGIFFIGLQTSKIEFKDLSLRPLLLGLIIWIVVMPMAYLVSVS